MKRRDILFKSINKKASKINVGLVGIHRGDGVTQTGLMMAMYLGEYKNKQTAFIEFNDHQDMEIIESCFNWDKTDSNSFSFNLIICHKKVKQSQMIKILTGESEYHIIDFGHDISENIDEFLRCDIKIVLCSHGKWKQKKLYDFIEHHKETNGNSNWIYLIPCGNEKTIRNLRKNLERRIYKIPFEDNPIKLSKETIRLFNQLF